MTDLALPGSIEPALRRGPDLERGFHPLSGIIFMGVIAAALLFVAYSIYVDVDEAGARATTLLPYILLFVALLIALGFEFVNGFHDTANAVAEHFVANSRAASAVIEQKASGHRILGDPRPAVTNYVAQRQINEGTYPSLAVLVREIS